MGGGRPITQTEQGNIAEDTEAEEFAEIWIVHPVASPA